MSRRFFCPDLGERASLVTLDAAQSTHAMKVLRASVGDEVELFDGDGRQAAAVIVDLSRSACVCRHDGATSVDRRPSGCLELAIALPKPDRAKEMMERLTELGVVKVSPIVCQRTQRDPADGLVDKLRRIVIEACKQSRRNDLLVIESPRTLAQFLAESGGTGPMETGPMETGPMDTGPQTNGLRWVATPGGEMGPPPSSTPASAVAIIGPEGGLTEPELAACHAASFVPIGLGKRILRVETAAVVVAARFLVD